MLHRLIAIRYDGPCTSIQRQHFFFVPDFSEQSLQSDMTHFRQRSKRILFMEDLFNAHQQHSTNIYIYVHSQSHDGNGIAD